MLEPTPLDRAQAAMAAAPRDDALRLRFYARLADAELFLLLTAEPDGADIQPEIFETEEGQFVLAFDREDRLSSFTGKPAPYVALSGRTIAGMLAGHGTGLGLNIGVGRSETLLPADAVDWLARTLSEAPAEVQARPSELSTPAGLPEALVTALDEKLAAAGGLASHALLAGVTYDDGRQGHLLAFIDAARGADKALARAAHEALSFSGLDAGEIDVGFFASDESFATRLTRVGLRFDLPQLEEGLTPKAPGSDPKMPPRLR